MTTENGHATPLMSSTSTYSGGGGITTSAVDVVDRPGPSPELDGHHGQTPGNSGPLAVVDALAADADTAALASAGFYDVPPPPPVPVPEVPLSNIPPGPLSDLAYRWRARIIIPGRPDEIAGAARPYVVAAPDGPVPTAAMPLPVWMREPGTPPGAGRNVQVGTVTSAYLADGAHGIEVCAAGEFDLSVPFVPGLVGDLGRVAALGHPLVAAPILTDQTYAEDPEGYTGPRIMTSWRLSGLLIGPGMTWPGCLIVPDEAQVGIELCGGVYPMRRHYHRQTWRALCTGYREMNKPGSEAYDTLTSTLAVLAGATTRHALNEISARMVDEGDRLTLAALMAATPGIIEALDADDAHRGGVLR